MMSTFVSGLSRTFLDMRASHVNSWCERRLLRNINTVLASSVASSLVTVHLTANVSILRQVYQAWLALAVVASLRFTALDAFAKGESLMRWH